jgi:hypothetical protein
MSFDLAVWYPQERGSNKKASEVYRRLCENDTRAVEAHPAIEAFYEELTAVAPEIDDIPSEKVGDFDDCPWSYKLDRSPGHVIMSCGFHRVAYVEKLVGELARKHGLAVYDPQSVRVTYPDGTTGAPAESSAVAMWILGFFALTFSAMFVYAAQIDPSVSPTAIYIFAGLCVLMATACFRKAVKRKSPDGNPTGRQQN